MRMLVLVVIAGCAIDPVDDPALSLEAVTRTQLEQSCDALLRAYNGNACATENGRQTCIVTTAVQPPRALRIGDWIPSLSTLETCTGSACTPVKLATPQQAYHCPSVWACLPLRATPCPDPEDAVNCQPDGHGGLYCTCYGQD